jgi:hypothetical protein
LCRKTIEINGTEYLLILEEREDMVTMEKTKVVANRALICEMRHAGAPMREIAEKMGISKERVRQILESNLGSTRHGWLSTLQLCSISGMPRNRVVELCEQGKITPATNWTTGKRRYYLWAPTVPEEINAYYRTHHLCQVCQRPLPRNRIRFCSDACRQERHKYKHMTPIEKKRVLESIKRYRERKRLVGLSLAPDRMPVQAAAVR